jgi:hypothetical protein
MWTYATWSAHRGWLSQLIAMKMELLNLLYDLNSYYIIYCCCCNCCCYCYCILFCLCCKLYY